MSKNEPKFRHPSEMGKDEKEPVSARVTITTKAILEKHAKKNEIKLATLIGNVLEDYAEWLLKNPKK